MKKNVLSLFLVLVLVFSSGCSLLGASNTPSSDTLKTLGIAYSEGEYSLTQASCYGFLTTSQTEVCLTVPVSKRLVEGQNVNIHTITNAELRINGTYVVKLAADLTQYINFAQIRNDGAVIFISLKNPDKWVGENNQLIPNNMPLTGRIDLTFTVTES